MEHTEGQKAQIRALFAIRRRRQLLLSLPLFALIMGFAFLENGNTGAILGIPASMILPVFLAIVVGAVLFFVEEVRVGRLGEMLPGTEPGTG